MRIGALEAGGTKMVCAVGDETGMIFERTRIPTTMPEETLNALVEWFQDKEIEGHRLLWAGGSAPQLENLWMYHDHAQARLGLVRYGGDVSPGAGCQRGV